MKLDESLAALVKSEPKTKAARQAKKLGLRYMGFGRYADKSGKVKFTVDQQRDMLVPYKSSEELYRMETQMYDLRDELYDAEDVNKKTKAKEKYDSLKNTLKSTQKQRGQLSREIHKHVYFNKKKEKRYADALAKFYKPELFDEKELEAIESYTRDSDDINRYVYAGHDGKSFTSPELISTIHRNVALLDSAFDQTETPIPFTTYTGLSARYNPKNFKVGQTYIFKGYVSTSLSSNTAIDEFAVESGFFLQIDVPKGAKGIYVESLSESKGEHEFLLPRGSHIKVISGPHVVDAAITDPWSMDSMANVDGDTNVFFHCELIVEKEE